MGRRTKYKLKYTKELLNGIRRTPDIYCGSEYLMSVERLCWRWGITRKTYYGWVNEYTSFREAHEIGETDFIVCCQEWVTNEGRKGKQANSILTRYLMGNIGSGMADKKEVNTNFTSEPQKLSFNFNILPPAAIPDDDAPTIIEGKVVKLALNDKSN